MICAQRTLPLEIEPPCTDSENGFAEAAGPVVLCSNQF